VVFPVVVLALFSTGLIKVQCPVDGGTGTLSQSVGMENLQVLSIESRVLSSEQDHCTNYIVTRADPIFTLSNTGTQTAKGYLVLHLYDLKTGQLLISQNMPVEAAPNSLTVLESEVSFGYNTIDRAPEDMDIKAEISLANIPCVPSGGTGRVSLSTYWLTKFYKDSVVSYTRSQQQYAVSDWVTVNGKVVQVGSKEWLDWMELS
jgi:hypothetical protein